MPTFHSWSGCHDTCIVGIVSELINDDYTCYLEYDIAMTAKTKVVLDIYAVKGQKELLVEVGYLSSQQGNRLELLKSLMPNAKVVWVKQWKNYFSVYDCDQELFASRQKVEEEDETTI